ncbi:MAG TPA: response regulator, partial [Candidatus Paceibacterota bacterium]
MYNVMIIDDEITICRGLKALINWNEYGFQVTSQALNGSDALGILSVEKVDVIITDIRMPKIDGLELVKNLRKKNYPVKIILMSGYKDFEYAREAMEYGVKSYILKPINENILIKILKTIKDELEQEMLQKCILHQSEKIINSKILKDVMKKVTNVLNARDKIVELDIKLGVTFRVCIVDIDFIEQSLFKINSIEIENIVNLFLEKHKIGHIFELEYNQIGIFLTLDDKQIFDINIWVEDLLLTISKQLGKYFTIAIGNLVNKFEEISESYKNACTALEYKIDTGNNRIIYFDNLNINFDLSNFKWNFKNLNVYIAACDQEAIRFEIKNLKHEIILKNCSLK